MEEKWKRSYRIKERRNKWFDGHMLFAEGNVAQFIGSCYPWQKAWAASSEINVGLPNDRNWGEMPLRVLNVDLKVANSLLESFVYLLSAMIRGRADKSLARPGRKQATANKLGIYSTYSPQNSIHFLAPCSNLCKPLKKKNQEIVRPTRSPRQ